MASPPLPKLPEISTLFSQSWTIFTTNFAKFLVISLVPGGIGLVIGLIIALFGVIFSLFSISTETLLPFLPILIPLAILILVGFIIIFGWVQITLIQAIKFSLDNTPWTIKSAFKSSWPKLSSFWWLGFVSCFSIFGGFIFFFIPGLIMAIWFSLAVYILVDENLTGIPALLKSRAYVKNYFWPVFGRRLIVWLLLILIGIITSLFSFIPIAGNLAQSALNVITSIFTTIFSFILFRQLKAINPQENFTPSSSSKTLVTVSILFALIIPILAILGTIFLVTTNIGS